MADEQDTDTKALEDGSYIMMILAQSGRGPNTGFAVDLPGAKDVYQNNARFQTWGRNDSSAQVVTITTQEDGNRVITFPLCNKVLACADIEITTDEETGQITGYKPAYGSTLVPQDNTGQEQAWWNIVSTDAVVDYESENRRVYIVQPASATEYVLQAQSPTISNGVKLIVQPAPQGGAWQRFFFLPRAAVSEGAYRIFNVGQVNTVLSMNGSSVGRSGVDYNAMSNAQIWSVQFDEFNRAFIKNLGNDLYLATNGTNKAAAAKPFTNGNEQKWMFHQADFVKKYGGANNEDWISYQLHPVLGDNTPTLDARNTNNVLSSTVYVRDQTFTKDVQWIFKPALAYGTSGIGTPSDIRHYCSYTREDVELQRGRGTVALYPTWAASDEEYWQCRYRTRARRKGQANNILSANQDSGWSAWKSYYDDSTANGGWGTVDYPPEDVGGDIQIVPNCDATLGPSRWRADQGKELEITATANDYWEIQYEICAFQYEWGDDRIPAHGPSIVQKCRLAYEPVLTLSNLKITGSGVSIDYVSDFPRTGNTIRIWVDGTFSLSGSGLNYSGTLSDSKIQRIVQNGEYLSVKWSITTCDGITVTSADLMQAYVEFYDGEIDSMNATTDIIYGEEHGYLQKIELEYKNSQRLFVQTIESDGIEQLVEIDPLDDVFWVPRPFNIPYDILAYAIDNEGHARIFKKHYKLKNEIWTRVWSFGDDWFEAYININEAPTESVDIQPSTNTALTTGRQYQMVQVGHTLSESRSIAAILLDTRDTDALARMDRFIKARFTWYRSPRGEILRVAVTKLNEQRHHEYINFTISMTRTDA